MHERAKKAHDEARRQTRICADWLRTIIGLEGPKTFTKTELCDEAMRRWGVSKIAFDMAWIWVIEELGRQDWYEPLRTRKIGKPN